MYIALTEAQAKGIRQLDMQVIEWKRFVKKSVSVDVNAIRKLIDKIYRACQEIVDAMREYVDTADMIYEEIKEKFNYPVSRRYKIAKILGSIGYDKKRVWTLTRRTWLARSNC